MVSVSVVIPAFQAAGTLGQALSGLRASTSQPAQIIVVDDGSTDESAQIARDRGAAVVPTSGGPLGPAAARNLGAAHAHGDIIFFLDADVVVHADTIARLIAHFEAEPNAAAIFGSYDDQPAVKTKLSQYRNLLHHFV